MAKKTDHVEYDPVTGKWKGHCPHCPYFVAPSRLERGTFPSWTKTLESIAVGAIILGGVAFVVGWLFATAIAASTGHHVICAVLAVPIVLLVSWAIGAAS